MTFKPKGSPKGKNPEPGNPEPATAGEVEILPPEKSLAKASSASSGTTSSADHIEDAAAEIAEPGPELSADTGENGGAGYGTADDDGGSSREPGPPPGALPFDAWYETFVELHDDAGTMLELQSPSIWVRRPLGRPAAQALYRTCCRYKWLHWALFKGASQWRDALVILLYTGPLAMAIRYEMQMKAAAAASAQSAGAESRTDQGGGAAGRTAGNGGGRGDDPLSRAARERET